ncbi:MAG TPA: alkaline phosphatase family protein, partial [Streptosporangiaceae bacterium]
MGASPANNPIRRLSQRRGMRNTALVAVPAVAAALTVSGISLASSPNVLPANAVPVPATAPASLYHVPNTNTPIKHVVVLFDENVSFDHYFGTYPNAANTDGSPFHAKPGTPAVNGLTPALLNDNPNEFNPVRLTHSEALTCDQNHSYGPEEASFDQGKMDMFVQDTSVDTCTGQPLLFGAPGLAMDYFDGNTVTGLWNYAQNYAMSDTDFDTDFGPSSPGAINVVSGNASGGYAADANDTSTPGVKTTAAGSVSALGSDGTGTIYGDIDPFYDQCSDGNHTSTSPEGVLTGENIGDLLNGKHVTWGWFQGGFTPTSTNAGGAVCGSQHELTSNGQNVSE